MRVLIAPSTTQVPEDNGIGRVVHAQYKYIPATGIHVIDGKSNTDQADLLALHVQQFDFPRVDVLFVHGLYWTAEPGSGVYSGWNHGANSKIVEAARRAISIVVPSNWVAECFRRDMRIEPFVVGHGLDTSDWTPGEPDDYMLWNKNRPGDVCNPNPPYMMAERGIRVVTTFVPNGRVPLDNLRVTGKLPEPEMKSLVRNAGTYLATVKETFGIGTLEAMASGVPVVGFNWGGTADIVRNGVDGILVAPGDYDGLVLAHDHVLRNRSYYSQNCIERAKEFTWEKAAERYKQVFEYTLDRKHNETGRVSIVITNHNYKQYVGGAIDSALNQTVPSEVIVVDDGSTDGSVGEVISHYPVKVIQQTNKGVAAARTAGISAATGDYIICLDADDKLDERYVQTLKPVMDADRGLGVTYTGLGLLDASGNVHPNPWPPEFDWEHMTAGGNPPASCIPSAAMFRKDMWRRAGPHKQQYAPGEDTEFWVRGLSVGFTARRVVQDYLIHYRPHEGSASRTKKYKRIDDWLPWMRDKQYPMAAPSVKVPYVRSYSEPKVSVIIPVAPAHSPYVESAIESVLGQTYRDWELIIVHDAFSGKMPQLLNPKYPFIREFVTKGGPAACRNMGIDMAKAPAVVFLDADDYLTPNALFELTKRFDGRYVYSDWSWLNKDGTMEVAASRDFDPKEALLAMIHPVTALVPADYARRVRFNESLPILEDYDFFARCVTIGLWGVRVNEPLVVVRRYSGTQREKKKNLKEVWDQIEKQFVDYLEDRKPMACGSCGGGQATYSLRAEEIVSTPDGGMVRMEFTGEQRGEITYGGPGVTPSGRSYRGANNAFAKYVNASPEDVNWLVGSGMWRVVQQPVQTQPQTVERVPVPEPPVQVIDETLDTPAATVKKGKKAKAQ